ncbi:MAG: ATP-dependent helicase [Candidatus Saganbacteria bacterium]|nr:ATP-dependent helicase [Candidatus Saganbacteria bacterium]
MTKKYILKPSFETGVKYKIDYKKDLTEEQFPIVTAPPGPILVIAGAGSGKTRTITYRVAYLVESGIPLEKILLVTFTNKAAKEMLHRVENLLQKDLAGLWGGTFHHIGNMILRKHAKLLGYESNYTILDRTDSKEILQACVADAGIDTKAKRFPKGDVLQDILGYSVNTRTKPEEAIMLRTPFFEDITHDILRVFDLYDKRKKRQNLMDFDDLLYYWWKLLKEHQNIREIYSRKFDHILVDEYQDTNIIQAEIIDVLAEKHRNVMVVGDDSQSIYSFRGAHFKNIINFPNRYPDAEIFKLEVNHRSTPEILDFANVSIEHADEHFEKHLRAIRKGGAKPVLVPVNDVYEQAKFVAQRILELRDEEVPLTDMAVLYRSHYHSMELQMEFTRRGIPFEIRSGLRFFEEAHIKDVLAHLKVFHNPYEELAWRRILKLIPKVGVKTSEKVWENISKTKEPLESISGKDIFSVLPKGAEAKFKEFVGTIKLLKKELGAPAEMIKTIIKRGYSDHLKAEYPNYVNRLEDLNQLASYALQYDSLEKFLSELALVGGIVAEDIVAAGNGDNEACVLSTVHQAKGLEWSRVFIIWLADGRFPSYLTFGNKAQEEEERRLFYVAVTRTKDELYLIYPLTYSGFDGEVLMKASRFLDEIPEDKYEEWTVEGESPFREINLEDL